MLEGKEVPAESQTKVAKKKSRKKHYKKVLFTQKNNRHKTSRKYEGEHHEVYWEIEKILDERLNLEGNHEVLIKWKGWASRYNSWEPVAHLNDDLKNVMATLEKEKAEKKKTVRRCRKHRKIKKKKSFDLESEGSNTYDIEEILDKKFENGQTYFLIKWHGFPEEYNTWEPRKNLAASNIAALKRRINQEKSQNFNYPEKGEKEPTKVQISLKLLQDAEVSSEQIVSEGEKTSEKEHEQNGRMLDEESKSSQIIDEEKIKESDEDSVEEEPWLNLSELRRELREKKVQMKLFEENIQMLKRGMSSEDILNNRLDMPENFQYETEERGYGPEDKNFYEHRIENHRCDDNNQVEAFKVLATSKMEVSRAPIVFWCDIADAREKFAQETMEYLINFLPS